MKVLVVLRMVPDSACELELAADGIGLDREWLDFKLNDFDDQALEEAILIKEAVGAEVIVLGLGEGINRMLQMALARGADAATELTSNADEMISSREISADVTAFAAANAIDLILTGVQTPEDLHGQLGPYVAAQLGWPCLSSTSHVRAAGRTLAVSQERGGGVISRYEVELPAVLGVQTATKAPRYVSGTKLREASRLPIGQAEPEAEKLANMGHLVALEEPQGTGQSVSLGNDVADIAAKFLEILRA